MLTSQTKNFKSFFILCRTVETSLLSTQTGQKKHALFSNHKKGAFLSKLLRSGRSQNSANPLHPFVGRHFFQRLRQFVPPIRVFRAGAGDIHLIRLI